MEKRSASLRRGRREIREVDDARGRGGASLHVGVE